jgi:hypothetical protein
MRVRDRAGEFRLSSGPAGRITVNFSLAGRFFQGTVVRYGPADARWVPWLRVPGQAALPDEWLQVTQLYGELGS